MDLYSCVLSVLCLGAPAEPDNNVQAQGVSRSYVQSNGDMFIQFANYRYSDQQKMIDTCNRIGFNTGNVQAKRVCAQDLMKATPAFQTVASLIVSVVDDNPECAEHMLYEFIPKDQEPVTFAWLAALIGKIYVERKSESDAARLLTDSLRAAPNVYAIQQMVNMHQVSDHWQAAVYWIAKHTDKNFEQSYFKPGSLEDLYQTIDAEERERLADANLKKPEYDFKQNMALILKYEKDAGCYDGASLFEYES